MTEFQNLFKKRHFSISSTARHFKISSKIQDFLIRIIDWLGMSKHKAKNNSYLNSDDGAGKRDEYVFFFIFTRKF
jgi:hypothetical protein